MSRPFIASPQQQDFFDWIETGSGSLVLEAVAGSGKTETLARGADFMQGSIACMMFNKSAATEFKARTARVGTARDRFFIGTVHSNGFNAWRRFEPNCDLDERKVSNIIEAMAADLNEDVDTRAILQNSGKFIDKLVGFGKQMLMGVKCNHGSMKGWMTIISHFGLDEELSEDVPLPEVVAVAIRVFERSANMCRSTETRKGVIDFDDMIWAPLAFNVRFFTNDWVLIDEAQDTNPARRELARRMLRPGGRLVAVGDSRQAIYGFTGASADALDLIAKEFNCTRLPLSVTYRCPKTVVAHAQRWVSHIQAHETAPQGVVRPVLLDKPKEGAKPRPWFVSDAPAIVDAIVCRYNKPLVSTAFAMLAEGIPCKMEGRDIGQGLIALAKRWSVKTLDALENRLAKFKEKEIAKAGKSETKRQSVEDRVECLMVFIKRCRDQGKNTVACVVEEISSLFQDDVKGVVTLCSGHRSKGREWPRVFWIETEVRGKNLQDWELVQEDNLKYVMTTRAMEELVLLPEGVK